MIPLLSVLTVLIAGIIALVPVLYPRHSIYRRKSQIAIEKLQDMEPGNDISDEFIAGGISEDEMYTGVLARGDTGFRVVASAVDSNTPFNGPFRCFFLLHVESPGLVLGESGPSRGNKGIFGAIDEDGNHRELSRHPFDVERVLELRELRSWIDQIIQQRTQYWTVFLVLVWTSISTWTRIQ